MLTLYVLKWWARCSFYEDFDPTNREDTTEKVNSQFFKGFSISEQEESLIYLFVQFLRVNNKIVKLKRSWEDKKDPKNLDVANLA
jgi:hypothetical protein